MTNKYLENMVNTANPVRLVILLYEKAIACLRTAVEIMEKPEETPEDLRRKLEALSRASDILTVLDGTLNFEKGGEIARNLHEIYHGLLNDLLKVSFKDDPETVKRMIRVLEDLRAAWVEVEKDLKKKGQLKIAGQDHYEKSERLAARL